MSQRVLKWILSLVIGFFGVGGAVILIATAYAILSGNGMSVPLPVHLSNVAPTDVLLRDSQEIVGSLTLNRGRVVVKLHDPLTIAGLGICLVMMIGLVIYALTMFRRLVVEIAMGNPFAATAVSRLRCAGWSLILSDFVSIPFSWLCAEAVAQDVMLADGRALLVSTPLLWFSENTDPRIALEMDFWFSFVGLILLALAEAFRIGRSLREESEGII
ncbi:DUF2975 domain-containing protein [Niveispirillum sp. KHB5.9]|uniref:DUF2975 domain-containing protein n=1 Tax=Niveispirillum sp. KHB5.9 TaxID=3400269 RepID=UPI003A8867D0